MQENPTKLLGEVQNTNEQYHNGPGVSQSRLGYILKSPLHYRDRAWSGSQFEQTESMAIGSAAHALALDPREEIAVFTTTKTRGVKFRDFEKANEGKICLTESELFRAEGIARSLLMCPDAVELLGGVRERSIYWEDQETGLLCKCRPDSRLPNVLVDLKTTKSCTGFANSFVDYEYYRQAAWYREGIEAAGFGPVKEVLIIAVENVPPFDLMIFQPDEESIAYGHHQNHLALARLNFCLENDEWPGYSKERQVLSLPGWFKKQNEIFDV